MKFERKPSFDRAWKQLPATRKIKAAEAIATLVAFFEGDPKPDGLGLKKLRDHIWEIRTDLKDRILFRLTPGRVEFVLIGNHDDIHRVLKRI